MTAGTYGGVAGVPRFNIDAKGRVLGATNVVMQATSPVLLTTSGTGTLAWSLATSGATAGTYGNSTAVGQVVVDAFGRVTSATNVGIAGAGTLAVTDGTTTATSLNLILFATGATVTGTSGTATVAVAGGTGGGGASWNSITAATANGTTSNGTAQIEYRVQSTQGTRVSWRFTESAASTGGTSASGIPNQVLLQLDTVSNSTQSPLKVLSRGVHVFSINPVAAQILANIGSSTSPTYTFANDDDTGMYSTFSNRIGFTCGTALTLRLGPQVHVRAYNSGTIPDITDNTSGNSGVGIGDQLVRVIINSVENAYFGNGLVNQSKFSADAVGYAVSFKKSRGSISSPSAVTSGDDLATISGYGYVGATNTYREAARIAFDSAGTISDATNGIGGIIRFSTQLQGTDTSPQERWRIEQGGFWIGQQLSADPGTTVVGTTEIALYRKNSKLVAAHNLGGTMYFLSIPLDGTSTSWTQGTTAP